MWGSIYYKSYDGRVRDYPTHRTPLWLWEHERTVTREETRYWTKIERDHEQPSR